MAKQPLGGRPTKAALVRIKLATAVVSLAAFVASLGIVAYVNPGVHLAATGAQATSLTAVAAGSSTSLSSTASLQLPSLPQTSSIQPLTRTRGS